MSVQAKFITFILRLSNANKMVEKSFLNPARSTKPLVTKYLRRSFNVSEFQVLGKSVVTIQPKTQVTNMHVLYFHGGAYLLEGNSMHWKIVETVVNKANCKVSYIDYPLAPECTYKITFDMVQQSFDRLTQQYPNDRFMLMGDSAGGGLALAFAQKLANENAVVQPVKNILFSPWLDLSMQNPEIKKQESLDKLLPLQGLIEAGKKYAGGDDVNNYLLSPINGNMAGIGETIIFYGTHELFYPDCKKMKDKTISLGNFTFHEFHEMQHDWVILPIPEAKEALNIAIEFINKKSGM
jgi:acetyl esterase/lipase